MDRQAPSSVNCFLDKDRTCDEECKAHRSPDKCLILDSAETLPKSVKKMASVWTSLARALERRPPPRL